MKTASELPSELQEKRDELASNHAFQMMRTMEGASPNTRRDFKSGFNKCHELMSEREAKLKAQLEKARELFDDAIQSQCPDDQWVIKMHFYDKEISESGNE